MSESVKKLFDDISPTYDRLNHMLSLNIDRSWRKKTIGRIRQQRDANFRVLDLCTGTFDLALQCLSNFPNSQIDAADFSPDMLAAGQHKIANTSITSVCADALNLPYPDNTFDVVMCGYGMRNLDDKVKGVSEIFRVLKPSGQILILEFFKPTRMPAKVFHKTYGEYIMPKLGHFISGHKSAYSYLRDSIRGFMTIQEFEGILAGAGFTKIGHKDFLFAISTLAMATKPL